VKSEANHRLIAVASACELFAEIKKLADLPDVVMKQVQRFFISYNEQRGKKFEVRGCHGRRQAAKILMAGRTRYRRGKR
jgi:inorganic pyrophosphatase